MAYPLLTATTRTSAVTVIVPPVEAPVTASRAWSSLPTFQRTGSVYIWQTPLPPQTGQIWPRRGG